MSKMSLRKVLINLVSYKEIIVASSIILAGVTFVITGDPWDTDGVWL